jgi:hypothetical protein
MNFEAANAWRDRVTRSRRNETRSAWKNDRNNDSVPTANGRGGSELVFAQQPQAAPKLCCVRLLFEGDDIPVICRLCATVAHRPAISSLAAAV